MGAVIAVEVELAERLRQMADRIERGELYIAAATFEQHCKQNNKPGDLDECWIVTGGQTIELVLADTEAEAKRLRAERDSNPEIASYDGGTD